MVKGDKFLDVQVLLLYARGYIEASDHERKRAEILVSALEKIIRLCHGDSSIYSKFALERYREEKPDHHTVTISCKKCNSNALEVNHKTNKLYCDSCGWGEGK